MSDSGFRKTVKDFLSGGAGGMSLVFAGHPLDLIKVRLQTMEHIPGKAPQYSGTLDCARQTIQREGVRGLYKGMSAPLIGITPIFAVCFWAYGVGKSIMRSIRGVEDDSQLSLLDIGLAGAFSAVPTTAIMAPGERIKCILQTQGQSGTKAKYNGPMDVAKGLYREGGLRSVFRGSLATLLRDGFGSMAYFSVYEGIKRSLTPEDGALSPTAVILGGGFAGVCNWLIAIPFDTVKSRLQTAAEGEYKGFVDCYQRIVAEGGQKALFKGAGPAMLRAFPANAACFLGVELSLKAMNAIF